MWLTLNLLTKLQLKTDSSMTSRLLDFTSSLYDYYKYLATSAAVIKANTKTAQYKN